MKHHRDCECSTCYPHNIEAQDGKKIDADGRVLTPICVGLFIQELEYYGDKVYMWYEVEGDEECMQLWQWEELNND